MTVQDIIVNGNHDYEGVGQIKGAVLEQRTSDRSEEGTIWERTDLDEIRAFINGAAVTVYPTAAGYTDEQAQDAVGGILVDGTTIDFTYADGTPSITAEVINGTITNAKLADMAADTIKGRANGAGTGAPQDLTATQVRTIINVENGATADQTAAEILAALLTVDGAGSGLDADLLDGVSSAGFQAAGAAAGGVLSGTYPNPGFAADMATQAELDAHVNDTSDAHDASAISTTTFGTIGSTDVQAALQEIDTELRQLVSDTVEGRKWKDPVDAATTAALPAVTYNAGAGTLTADANGALAAQDGVTLAAGDSLLVKNQASTFQDGIYDVTDAGGAGTPFILTRRADSSTATELTDAATAVEGGTVAAGRVIIQTATLANLTASAQTWTVSNLNNTYTADESTLTLTGNQFSEKDGGTTNAKLANMAAATLKGRALGAGTGVPTDLTAAQGRALLVTVGLYKVDIGDAVATDFTLTHGYTGDTMSVVVIKNSTGRMEVVPWKQLSSTQIEVNFAAAPSSNEYNVRVLVNG